MPVFGSHYSVTIVRGRGTSDEESWEARMGGDLARKALFCLDDQVKTGDEIHGEAFDEPRIISRVDPVSTMSGISHWQAEMMPRSEWDFRHRATLPSITVSGQGARVNLGSIDRSVQHFHNQQADHAAVLHALDEILEAIQQTIRSPTDSNDAAVDVEQIRMELQRSKPEKGRIWTLVDRLSSLAGLAEKVAKLTPLLQQLGF